MSHQRSRGGRRPRGGAAAAELGIVLSILFFVTVGILDFARLFYYYETIATCARNGALWASDPSSQSQSPYATASAAALADAGNLSPTPTVDSPYYATSASGAVTSTSTAPLTSGYVRVTVHGQFQTLFGFRGYPHTMTLSRSVVMKIIPSS
jgi:Flp pilus assembly protein TadG